MVLNPEVSLIASKLQRQLDNFEALKCSRNNPKAIRCSTSEATSYLLKMSSPQIPLMKKTAVGANSHGTKKVGGHRILCLLVPLPSHYIASWSNSSIVKPFTALHMLTNPKYLSTELFSSPDTTPHLLMMFLQASNTMSLKLSSSSPSHPKPTF